MTNDIHIHLHFHPGAGDVPVPLFNELKRILTVNQAELATALGGLQTALGDVATQLDKGINEVILALQNAGNTSAEVDAKVAALQGIATALKTATQTLDDMNVDTPTA